MNKLSKHDLEEGVILSPSFDASGLITAVAVEATTRTVLMVAHMNAEALRQTRLTGIAHYYSRSRQALWKKGETSGQLQHVQRISIDCDQDAVVLEVSVDGDGGCCHTGRPTCFYRTVPMLNNNMGSDDDGLELNAPPR